MIINKRIMIESIIVSILIFVFSVWIKIIQGAINTQKHVPDLIDSYSSANYLQEQVSFGVVYSNGYNWAIIPLGIAIFISLILLYYGIRVMINRWIKKEK